MGLIRAPTMGYKMMPMDIVKMGRVRFRVREIVSPAYKKREIRAMCIKRKISEKLDAKHIEMDLSASWSVDNIQYEPTPMNEPRSPMGKTSEPLIIRHASQVSLGGSLPICRICLSEEGDDQRNINPLFSPCKCAGTMKYIHLNCL